MGREERQRPLSPTMEARLMRQNRLMSNRPKSVPLAPPTINIPVRRTMPVIIRRPKKRIGPVVVPSFQGGGVCFSHKSMPLADTVSVSDNEDADATTLSSADAQIYAINNTFQNKRHIYNRKPLMDKEDGSDTVTTATASGDSLFTPNQHSPGRSRRRSPTQNQDHIHPIHTVGRQRKFVQVPEDISSLGDSSPDHSQNGKIPPSDVRSIWDQDTQDHSSVSSSYSPGASPFSSCTADMYTKTRHAPTRETRTNLRSSNVCENPFEQRSAVHRDSQHSQSLASSVLHTSDDHACFTPTPESKVTTVSFDERNSNQNPDSQTSESICTPYRQSNPQLVDNGRRIIARPLKGTKWWEMTETESAWIEHKMKPIYDLLSQSQGEELPPPSSTAMLRIFECGEDEEHQKVKARKNVQNERSAETMSNEQQNAILDEVLDDMLEDNDGGSQLNLSVQ